MSPRSSISRRSRTSIFSSRCSTRPKASPVRCSRRWACRRSRSKSSCAAALQKLPRVTGGNVDQRIGNDLRSVLDGAEKEMAKLKDEFVSAEHYLLALTNANVPAARALKNLGVTRDKLMQALQQVRGSQRVTDQNPEGKYQTLEKYGRDLTELARRGKIDPVIGRDNEIRRVMQVLSRRTKNNPVLIGEPGRRQDRDRRRSRAPHHHRRRAGIAQEQEAHRDGHRRDGRGRKVSRRIRGPAEGVPERSDRFARARSSCSSTSCTRSSARARPKARSTLQICSSRNSRAANCARSARRRSTNIANTSRRTRRWSGASSR